MAFRFSIKDGDNTHLTDWFVESSVLAAPLVMSQIRVLFPDAEVETERGNAIDAKDPNTAVEDLKALKSQ